ncbi:ABC transporter ATP-binding protein [Modestobacter muralis]|uniref:ABC transporter ATP-binding protein n=1 Tax=Modestobacter muralis TaxID=1608614 RepID=A0A6P0ET99_9ACTN|nr:ABC transporter ATP-binding protein [Modestobacter muralis]NEN50496.1 ABC transporter ATP-binding protein [Modestobacter muralis]
MADPADLVTEALDLGYDGTRVVHALDLRLPPGQVTAIVGPNGCGKSTLLGALARVHEAQGGAVLLDGRDLATLRPRDAARRIGLLPQQAAAPDGLTVRDLVRYGRHPHQGLLRQWSPEDAAAVHGALAAADLLDLADRPLDQLSGGQRQRAWIAMVVAQQTAVVLLDEPTSALDLGHQLEVLELVADLAAQGRTVVLVLHDLSTACRHADHLVAMRDGRVVAEGPPADVVTAGLVRELYGVEAAVLRDPTSGTPVVCPVRRVAATG